MVLGHNTNFKLGVLSGGTGPQSVTRVRALSKAGIWAQLGKDSVWMQGQDPSLPGSRAQSLQVFSLTVAIPGSDHLMSLLDKLLNL